MSAVYRDDTCNSIVDGPSPMVTDSTLFKVYSRCNNDGRQPFSGSAHLAFRRVTPGSSSASRLSPNATGWRFVEVGGSLAARTIAYGGTKALAARLGDSADGPSCEVPSACLRAALLMVGPSVLALLRRPGLRRPCPMSWPGCCAAQ
jgi:hypothetical protein